MQLHVHVSCIRPGCILSCQVAYRDRFENYIPENKNLQCIYVHVLIEEDIARIVDWSPLYCHWVRVCTSTAGIVMIVWWPHSTMNCMTGVIPFRLLLFLFHSACCR